MTPDPKPTEALKPAPIPKSVNTRGFDHIHWSRINDKPLHEGMGRLSDSNAGRNKAEDGMIVLLARNSRGVHDTLFGPITVKQYRALS